MNHTQLLQQQRMNCYHRRDNKPGPWYSRRCLQGRERNLTDQHKGCSSLKGNQSNRIPTSFRNWTNIYRQHMEYNCFDLPRDKTQVRTDCRQGYPPLMCIRPHTSHRHLRILTRCMGCTCRYHMPYMSIAPCWRYTCPLDRLRSQSLRSSQSAHCICHQIYRNCEYINDCIMRRDEGLTSHIRYNLMNQLNHCNFLVDRVDSCNRRRHKMRLKDTECNRQTYRNYRNKKNINLLKSHCLWRSMANNSSKYHTCCMSIPGNKMYNLQK